MAVSQNEFVEKTGAEVVGDRFVVGTGANRRFVGDIVEGTFTLNQEGQELAAAIERGEDVQALLSGVAPEAGEEKPARTRATSKKNSDVA